MRRRRVVFVALVLAISFVTIFFSLELASGRVGGDGELAAGCFKDVAPQSSYLAVRHMLEPNPDMVPYDEFLTPSELKDQLFQAHEMPYGLKTADQNLLKRLVDDVAAGNMQLRDEQRLGNRKRKCVVVGSGGILSEHRLGEEIDGFYDHVIRVNAAPVAGYEKQVGCRTDVRVLSVKNVNLLLKTASDDVREVELARETLYLFALMKPEDVVWLGNVFGGEDRGHPFADSAAVFSSYKDHILLMNPKIVLETWHWLNREFKPSTGLIALNYALHTCDLVDIAGFSYGCDPSAALHYYGSSTRKWDWTGWGGVLGYHSYNLEANLVRDFVRAGIIRDLTGSTRVIVSSACANFSVSPNS